MRNILLGTAGVLFLAAFYFAVTARAFGSDPSGSDMPNVLAAATVLGFALAGGIALLAAAVVHCFDRFEGDRPDDVNSPPGAAR